MLTAPGEELAGVDVPGEIDQEIAGADVLGEQGAHVVLGHAVADEADALGGPLFELPGAVGEVHHGDILRRHLDVLEENGQRALGHGAVTDEEDFVFEFDHGSFLGKLWERRCAAMRRHFFGTRRRVQVYL